MVRVDILVLILEESFQSFTIDYDVSWWFFIDLLYQVEGIPSISSLLSVIFCHEHILDFNYFFMSMEIIIWSFAFINIIYYIIWFLYIEPTLHSCYKSYLVLVYDLFSMLLNFVSVKNFFIGLCSPRDAKKISYLYS